MYVKKEHVDGFFKATEEKFNKKGIRNFTDMGYVEGFQLLLDNIAQERHYQEGERIIMSDLNLIKNTVAMTLKEMKNIMVEQPLTMAQIEKMVGPKKFKKIQAMNDKDKKWEIRKLEKKGKLSTNDLIMYNPISALVAVNDYMYAMAMKTLGCPDIPDSFGADMQELIKEVAIDAEFEMKEKAYKKASTEEFYENQRGKDAKEVIAETAAIEKRLIEKKASPLGVAHYVGEYQALKKRQEGHGDVWKFFHKKENAAREKLITSMKELLVQALGEGVDFETREPVEIAKEYNKPFAESMAAEAFQENSIAKRTQMPATSFEREPTTTLRAETILDDPNKNEVEFDGELREAITFERGIFKESEPFIDVEGKFGAAGQAYEGYTEADLSEYNPEEFPMIRRH